MGYIIDNAIAMRIMYLLTAKFSSWPAYDDGTIDEDGNVIKKPTEGKKGNWTMLHRMVAKIKKLIGIAPGGKSMAAGALASYLLVKEGVDYNSDDELQSAFDAALAKVELDESLADLMEEMGSSVAIGGAGIAPNAEDDVDPLGPATIKNKYTKRNRMFRRQTFKEYIGR
jgi:hypothetical protein